jgi:hypothetical protein
MPNVENQTTKECRMTKPEWPDLSGFVIRASSFFLHLVFVIRHFLQRSSPKTSSRG